MPLIQRRRINVNRSKYVPKVIGMLFCGQDCFDNNQDISFPIQIILITMESLKYSLKSQTQSLGISWFSSCIVYIYTSACFNSRGFGTAMKKLAWMTLYSEIHYLQPSELSNPSRIYQYKRFYKIRKRFLSNECRNASKIS